MILVRSPLRLTLGGGGTDLPSYATRHGGFCLTASIDKYVYVGVTRPFYPGIYLKYSALEKVQAVCNIVHPILRLALTGQTQIEVTALADVPAGTGLGSSSSFTTALLQALAVYDHQYLSPERLAEAACELEIDKLAQPIGKQDQYAAALGGITALTFCEDGRVEHFRPQLSADARAHLADHLLLFFTGATQRSAADLLRDQDTRTKAADEAMLRNLSITKSIGEQTLCALLREDWEMFGAKLSEQYIQKLERAPESVTPEIARAHHAATRHMDGGALGGKLVGAGGGGFLLFYADSPTRLRRTMKEFGLDELRFRFDAEGTKVMLS